MKTFFLYEENNLNRFKNKGSLCYMYSVSRNLRENLKQNSWIREEEIYIFQSSRKVRLYMSVSRISKGPWEKLWRSIGMVGVEQRRTIPSLCSLDVPFPEGSGVLDGVSKGPWECVLNRGSVFKGHSLRSLACCQTSRFSSINNFVTLNNFQLCLHYRVFVYGQQIAIVNTK